VFAPAPPPFCEHFLRLPTFVVERIRGLHLPLLTSISSKAPQFSQLQEQTDHEDCCCSRRFRWLCRRVRSFFQQQQGAWHKSFLFQCRRPCSLCPVLDRNIRPQHITHHFARLPLVNLSLHQASLTTAEVANLRELPGSTAPIPAFDPFDVSTVGSDETFAWMQAALS